MQVFTAIPMTVVLQLLRRPQFVGSDYDFNYWWCPVELSNFAFISINMGIFYLGPILLGCIHCKTLKGVFWRYIYWMLLYVGPLAMLLVHESLIFGFWNDVKGQLLSLMFWLEIVCEVCIANVILSDIMYSNLHIERAAKESLQPAQSVSVLCPAWCMMRLWFGVKVLLLRVVPLVWLSCCTWALMRTLNISLLHGVQNGGRVNIMPADNGHPCPWEPQA